MFYEKHLFFCVNQREQGKCCAHAGAQHLRDYAKQRLRALNVKGLHFRVNQSGCLGRCPEGPSLVIYPEGVWYTYQNEADIDEILNTHVLNGQIVTRLLMAKREI